MKKFVRKRGRITSHLSSYEVSLLVSLTHQLTGLLTDLLADEDPQPASDDPFELWARDLAAEPSSPEMPEDPAIQRLFPNAYPHDEVAASDFRRFTTRDQRDRKLAAAQVVLADLAATEDGAVALSISPEHAEAWLKTLTSLRLTVAARLGISDADADSELALMNDDDPRAFMYSIYQWLGFAQETMVTALP